MHPAAAALGCRAGMRESEPTLLRHAGPLTWQGRRKCTASTEAVTQGPRANVLAASPAQMSIQLSTVPPCSQVGAAV